jgi:hypothetical protein
MLPTEVGALKSTGGLLGIIKYFDDRTTDLDSHDTEHALLAMGRDTAGEEDGVGRVDGLVVYTAI